MGKGDPAVEKRLDGHLVGGIQHRGGTAPGLERFAR
jgi:hypothetical protein